MRRVAGCLLFVLLAGSGFAGQLTATKSVAPVDLRWFAVTYTFVITNHGTPANVTFLDNVPVTLLNLNGVVVTGGGVLAINPATNQVTWSGSLADGVSVTFTITGTLRSGAIGTVPNQATVCDALLACVATDDPSLPGPADATSFTISRTVDALIAKEQLSASPVIPGSGGGNLRYRVTITAPASNPRAAQFLVADRPTNPSGDPLPAAVTIDAAIPSSGTWDAASRTWTTGFLDPGESATLDVTMTVGNDPALPDVLWNAAEVTGAVGLTLARNGVLAVVQTPLASGDAALPLFPPAVLILLAAVLAWIALRSHGSM